MHAIKWQDENNEGSSSKFYSSSYCEFIEEISKLVCSRYPAPESALIVDFAKYYFVNSPLVELSAAHIDDLYGELISTWQFIQQVVPGEAKVRVFNPSVEDNGWQSNHTVMEVIVPDMPFVVDSVRLALNREGIMVHSVINAALFFSREENKITRVDLHKSAALASGKREAVVHLVVAKQSEEKTDKLERELKAVLKELSHVVGDFDLMMNKVEEIEQKVKSTCLDALKEQVNEAEAFLSWMRQDNFTFLGFREYKFVRNGDQRKYFPIEESSLGVLRDNNTIDVLEHVEHRAALCSDLLVFAKSLTRSRIHRPAYIDLVLIKKFDDQGRIVGEYRILGHYTARVYSADPFQIPFIGNKLKAVYEQAGFSRQSHDGKELKRILSVYPRDELFQISDKELFNHVLGILYIKERRLVKLFVREDRYGRFISCLIFAPRDRYSTELREKFQHILSQVFLAEDVEFNAHFSESILTRVHIVLRIRPDSKVNYDTREIEQRLIEAYRSWDDDFYEALTDSFGEELGGAYADAYMSGFSSSYKEDFSARIAVCDIRSMESLTETNPVEISLYRTIELSEDVFRFKLFHGDMMIPLSDIVPVLENLGLRIMGETPYQVLRSKKSPVWIHDFIVCLETGRLINLEKVKSLFKTAFVKVWHGQLENDGLNKLILLSRLNWHEVALLRAYSKYFQQTNFPFSQAYIEQALAKHADIAKDIVQLFDCKFNPSIEGKKRESVEQARLDKILASLEAVEILDEDRILRMYVDVIQGTLRTNYFQLNGTGGESKDYIAFKFSPKLIPDLPLPLPEYEIFVYSPRVEGVHLRGGKVARGGLRWSDRREDFRTEILGLVKAQQVKNAVIVPVGAKGGFVAKCLPENGTRDEIISEVISSYKIFIAGMLDITDNLVEGKVVVPDRVVRKDGDDFYLVVAADKGTATFSDIANEMSQQYKFWLGDAFASGGSVGYDHKKMGITARGAWVSVQRHFREIGINVQEADFTVLGIGDMSGDVFGNGMLLSEHIRLLAAFNHAHIFIDPNPDASKSYHERKRLFDLPRSSWLDYNRELISKGGGVYSRSAKFIDLSAEIRQRFNISQTRLTPNELILRLLRAAVDLIWNGGIGTYVKASTESNADVGDKSNDCLRVDGKDMNCKVFGEGGNLGVTQLGRVELASRGVRLNTDFIDNVGGVDCSDHEVNIKILLNEISSKGDLTQKQRDNLLIEMTDEVSELVLSNNYQQVQALSIAQAQSAARIDEYRRYIQSLESSGRLNPSLEFLPSEDVINERKANFVGLTRPELSVLLSYSKSLLKQKLADSNLCDDPRIRSQIETAFPRTLVEKYGEKIYQHRLAHEIVATQVANSLVNFMGITYVQRMMDASGASEQDIARSFVAAKYIFRLDELWSEIQALDYKVESSVQVDMMIELTRVVRRGTRWFLRNRRGELDVQNTVEHFGPKITQMVDILPQLIKGHQKELWEKKRSSLLEQGVPERLASLVACSTSMLPLLGIIEAADITRCELEQVAEVYFLLGDQLDLYWFSTQINLLQANNHWEALAREAYRDDLDWQQRALTVGVLNCGKAEVSAEARIGQWRERHALLLQRWHSMIAELKAGSKTEFAMFSVALREILDIAQSTAHAPVENKS